MTAKTFYNKIANGKRDILEEFMELLQKENISYCVIGGLAVNAYAEPVMSLDFDVVIAVHEIERLLFVLPKHWSTKRDKFSINISSPDSDLRIQLQTDNRYQNFISRGEKKKVFGYECFVASLHDVLQGKLWAYADPERRQSKRQKDLADIMRLVETYPELLQFLPQKVREKISPSN